MRICFAIRCHPSISIKHGNDIGGYVAVSLQLKDLKSNYRRVTVVTGTATFAHISATPRQHFLDNRDHPNSNEIWARLSLSPSLPAEQE